VLRQKLMIGIVERQILTGVRVMVVTRHRQRSPNLTRGKSQAFAAAIDIWSSSRFFGDGTLAHGQSWCRRSSTGRELL
jgi:hypothetical protein